MTPERKCGQTDVAPINVLAPAEVDFSAGQPLPPSLGQTETPVNILPAFEIDMSEAVAAPALVLTLRLRSDTPPAAVAVDALLLHKVLNDYELSLGGSGLVLDERRSGPTDNDKAVRVVLTAADASGAADRLAKLAAVVNEATDPAFRSGVLAGRSFAGCEAELRIAA
jgi:hypothetical protein